MTLNEICHEIQAQCGNEKYFDIMAEFQLFSLVSFDKVESVHVDLEQKTIQLN